MVGLLLRAGADPSRAFQGQTALAIAAEKGHRTVAAMLNAAATAMLHAAATAAPGGAAGKPPAQPASTGHNA